MGLLQGIIKNVKNPYATIAEDGIVGGDVKYHICSGNLMLNALVSGKLKDGGYPSGKVVALAGEKGTGKTFVLIKAMKSFLDADPENEILFFESEGAVAKKTLEDRGVDTSRVAVYPVSTVEELRTQCVNALSFIDENTPEGEYPKVMVCLDSLGMLGTEWELNMAASGDSKADMGKRANLIKSVFRTITLKLGILQIPMIITNHTYSSMTNTGKKMGGGTGLEFAASIIIFLSKTKDKEDLGEKKGSTKIKTLVGNNVYFTVEKGRFTIEGSSATIPLNFKTGITYYGGLVDVLLKAGVIEKKGAWFKMTGAEKNLAQGEKNVAEMLPEIVTDEILEEYVKPYVEERFCYGIYR